jgi:tetrapyrrole methylase family protein/MazG family protein/ATP diphosphatase
MTVKNQDGSSLARLVAIMQRLLAPDGCPWDREQTFATIKKYVVEEAYEVVDGIDGLGEEAHRPVGPATVLASDDCPVLELREELGDLLLQVVFISELARARGWFGPDDVVAGISDKLERRHPHVFGEVKVSGTDEVLANWEKLKAAEKQGRGVLGGMPKGLPGLLYAFRLGEKASNVGFDWPDARGPREKIDEELAELDAAMASGDRDAMEHELGDVLFSVVNLARKRGIDPEAALRGANRRFETRFNAVEQRAKAEGRAIDSYTLDELDAFWREAKQGGRAR